MHPRSMKLVRQLVCQASKGDTINIWCPHTRYILSLIVNKINYSKVINITWSQGVQLCSLYPCPNKHLLKTFENIHTMERCLVWYPIVFPQNSRLLEWKLTAPTFNILFLTITHMPINTTNHYFFRALLQPIKQIGTYAQLWMVEFFPFRQAYKLFVVKFKCADQGRKYSHPSHCYIRDDLIRTQILHKSLDNIFYMIQSTYFSPVV